MGLRPALENLIDRKNIVGAEIGVRRGANAKNILKYLDIKKLYLIDPYAKYLDNEEVSKEVDYSPWPKRVGVINSIFNEAKANIVEWENVVEWIIDISSLASLNIEDNELDFVYIDGNHAYKNVLEDINLYWPKVKIGGLISGHDFDRRDSVAKTVRESFTNDLINFKPTGEGRTIDWWVFKNFECYK